MIYYGAKMDVVRFATALQAFSENAWQSTTITRVGKSEVYCVSTAIDGLSDGIVEKQAQTCSLRPTVTSQEITPVSVFQRKPK